MSMIYFLLFDKKLFDLWKSITVNAILITRNFKKITLLYYDACLLYQPHSTNNDNKSTIAKDRIT